MPNRIGLWTMWICEECHQAALEQLEMGTYVGAYQPDAAVYDTPCVFCGEMNQREDTGDRHPVWPDRDNH